MLKTYLINLDKDHERLDFMRQTFDTIGLTFERIAAIRGDQLSENEIHEFNISTCWDNGPWLVGQIGCFMSHFLAWQKVADANDQFSAIFEDDLHLCKSIYNALSESKWIPHDADIIRLEPPTNRVLLDKNTTYINDGASFNRIRSTSWCAGAYIISQSCARRLVRSERREYKPVDIFLFSFEESQIARSNTIYQSVPGLAIQDKFYNQSNISNKFQSNIDPNNNGKLLRLDGPVSLTIEIYKFFYKTLNGYKRVPFGCDNG